MNDATSKTILDALDSDALLPEEQGELIDQIGEIIYERSMIQILERMDEETKDAFEVLLAQDASEEQIEEFLHTHVPESDQIVEMTTQELTNDILTVTGESQD